MNPRGFDTYKAHAISTMTPSELMFLLFDELVKRLIQAELALNKQEFSLFETLTQKSIDIIQYLDATLDRQYPISKDLARLYEYFTYELERAKIGRHLEPLNHVKTMIIDLRGTFRQAQENVDNGILEVKQENVDSGIPDATQE